MYISADPRWNLFQPVWESSSASLSQTPLSVPEALPLSVTNISRASRPVLMTPEELRSERLRYASGIFIAYHHEVSVGAARSGRFLCSFPVKAGYVLLMASHA